MHSKIPSYIQTGLDHSGHTCVGHSHAIYSFLGHVGC